MFEIRLHLNKTQTLAAEILLEDLGAISITLTDAENNPIFVQEPGTTPLWKSIMLNALFTEDVDLSNLKRRLESALASSIEIDQYEIKEEDWQKKYIQNFDAMQFGERLWVCPSWIRYPDPFAINLRLDPGLAFGTGTHATTGLCLEWLANNSVMDKTVMDFGCGSGILAIAAYFLGANKIFAIDHDPQAIQATRINADKNRVDRNRFTVTLSNLPTAQKCDLLIANVLLKPLIELAPGFAEIVEPRGKIILSGILQEQLTSLENAYQGYFKFDAVLSKDEWVLIEASPIK